MRQIIYTLIFTLVAVWAFGQRVVEKTIELKKNSSVLLDLDFADSIKLTPSLNGNLVIKVLVNINDNQHNDKYELNATINNDKLTIEGKINDIENIKVPCKKGNSSHYYNNGDNCVTMDIFYEIQVPYIDKLSLKTINGDITISKLVLPMKIESISGYIDYSIAKEASALISIHSVTGGVYTNHEIDKSKDVYKSNPASIHAIFKLNEGRIPIDLKTISSDIYLREN